MRFEGKVAIVTGGASGIGRATALRFAAEGATVVMGDVDAEGGAALADGSKGRIRFLRTDVTQEADIVALIGAAEALGGPDILFNNAGAGGLRARIDEIDVEGWDRTMALLLRSVALGIRHAAPVMAKKGGGAIVNTASVAALAAGAAPTAYSAAKAAVVGLTRTMAKEWGQFKINCNAVAFGYIETRLTASKDDDNVMEIDGEKVQLGIPDQMRGIAKMIIPLGRPGTPEEAAGGVFFLCSPWSNFVHGQVLHITGGQMTGMSD